MRELIVVADKLGFKEGEGEVLYEKEEPDKKISIMEIDTKREDEDDPNPEINVYLLIEYGNFAHGSEVRGEETQKKGWVPLKNLGNYVGQLKIPTLEEHLKKYNRLIKY